MKGWDPSLRMVSACWEFAGVQTANASPQGLMSSVVKEASEHLGPRKFGPKRAFPKEPRAPTGSACLLLPEFSLRSRTKPIVGSLWAVTWEERKEQVVLKTLTPGVKPLCRWPRTGQRGRSRPEQGEGFPGIASTLTLPPSGPLVMPICHQAGISIKPPKEGSGVMQTGVVKATRLKGFPGAAGAGPSLYTAPIDPGRGPALFPTLH